MVIGIVRAIISVSVLSVAACAADSPCACMTAQDRQVIQAHYGSGAPGLPFTPAKKPVGPSEFHKLIKKNAALPAGLQSLVQPLPAALEAQLSAVPKGHKRVAADRYVFILAESGNVVTDFVDYTHRIGRVSWLTDMWR
jgi:hypothetical protein